MSYHKPNFQAPEAAVLALGDEISLCHFRMNAMLEHLHSDGISPSHRGVLRNLLEHGPMTIPEIAALRPVSRQYIQKVVGELLEKGYLATKPNPKHKQSFVVEISKRGRLRLNDMYEIEAVALNDAIGAAGVTMRQVEAARKVLARFRAAMDSRLSGADL